jgi:hypothetical protein
MLGRQEYQNLGYLVPIQSSAYPRTATKLQASKVVNPQEIPVSLEDADRITVQNHRRLGHKGNRRAPVLQDDTRRPGVGMGFEHFVQPDEYFNWDQEPLLANPTFARWIATITEDYRELISKWDNVTINTTEADLLPKLVE